MNPERHLRRLDWIVRAEPLIRDTRFPPPCFDAEVFEQRREALRQDTELMAELDTAERLRLGAYFEALYCTLLTRVYHWTVLARNLVIRDTQRTLGELDLLVRNPLDGAVEHHEVAVKFYLGCLTPRQSKTHWYGPNSRDRFDLKLTRLMTHQIQLSEQPVVRSYLQDLGLPLPSRQRVLMAGYLCYPNEPAIDSPLEANPKHLRARWARAREIPPHALNDAVVLNKPDWLGLARVSEAPDPALCRERLDSICDGGTPRLFARMRFDTPSQQWIEYERWFLVNEAWPQTA